MKDLRGCRNCVCDFGGVSIQWKFSIKHKVPCHKVWAQQEKRTCWVTLFIYRCVAWSCFSSDQMWLRIIKCWLEETVLVCCEVTGATLWNLRVLLKDVILDRQHPSLHPRGRTRVAALLPRPGQSVQFTTVLLSFMCNKSNVWCLSHLLVLLQFQMKLLVLDELIVHLLPSSLMSLIQLYFTSYVCDFLLSNRMSLECNMSHDFVLSLVLPVRVFVAFMLPCVCTWQPSLPSAFSYMEQLSGPQHSKDRENHLGLQQQL